ncbi:hypothetical protein [Parafrankia sp. FMc2]|uniref:hypothetical protein n=1 Tax=Parafrankia sp. FMc2 TaxID=3233196 RepID=UPI0034D56864
MPADDAPPGTGDAFASDPLREQKLRELLDQATRSVTAPAGLAARVRAREVSRHQTRRRALVIGAAALATSSVIVGGMAVEHHFTSGGGLSVITAADGSVLPTPATGTPANPGVPPAGVATSSPAAPAISLPPVTPARPDQATVDQIALAFNEAFDADDNVDDGLAYVQNGSEYHDLTVRFGQQYPGLVGNLRVRLEDITMNTSDRARATVVLTHSDPVLGARWGYEIRRGVEAVRVNGRWLVSASTYMFLVGTA